LKSFEETWDAPRRKTLAPAETSDSGALGLASAVGNQAMQRIAASPEAGRIGPGALSGSGGVLARSSVEGSMDEDTDSEEAPADAGAPEPEEAAAGGALPSGAAEALEDETVGNV
jgi:hypothetical protein